MKKIFILLALLLIFNSCNNSTSENVPPESEVKDSTITTENNVVENNTNDEAEPKEEYRQALSVEEIISLADEMNIDTSLTAFSLDGLFDDTQLSITDDAGDEYQNSTAFLGDSVTLGLAFFENHPSELVIAKGSINPLDAVDKKLIEAENGEMINFPDALALTGADKAVLTFGSNAISIMSEETFLNYYVKLINEIKAKCPDCKIIIQSITPLATTCTLKKLTNPLINRANLLLLILAHEHNVYFLNSAPALKDDSGYLKLEFCSSDDGIHINEEGYKVWINELRTHAIQE